MHRAMVALTLAVTCLIPGLAATAQAGCYDDRIGEEYVIEVGEEFCLKNSKWNCKPLCFYYAGMPGKDAFSLGVSKHQGALNLFYPFEGDMNTVFTINHNRFTVLHLEWGHLKVRYEGE